MDFHFSSEQQALYEQSQHFAMQEIAPHVMRLEEDLAFRRELFQKMGKAGLFSLILKYDALSYLLALKAIAKIDAGISVAMAVTNMVAETIFHFGTSDQKTHYLPKILNAPASFAVTERTAGSDVKGIQMTATLTQNGYVLEGEKQFITNGDISSVILVIAREGDGVSAFLLEGGAAGLKVIKKERKLGLLTANLVTLQFKQCHIQASQRLGESGQGLKIALSALDGGRLGIAVQAIGIAEAAFEAALSFSKQREQFGHAICDNQAIAFMLADMKVKLEAAKLLLYKAAWLKDQKQPFTLEASVAKLYSTEMCNEVASEALQIHGGRGYTKDYPVEKYFRDARVTTLYEGTSEIQRLIISRFILET